MIEDRDLLTIREASQWATEYLGRNVSAANISYLIQYGRVKKYNGHNTVKVSKRDLLRYYETHVSRKESEWKKELGEDLNWALSFDHLTEKERTKHVHRLHPYKGKFIPQLVEYFLDSHTDDFKREVYFSPGDIVLDPFCGSGTTLVQANELGIHAIGVDVSAFNAMMSNVKVRKHNLFELHGEIRRITIALKEYIAGKSYVRFEAELAEALTRFNQQYFPSPEFKYRVRRGEIDQMAYGAEKEEVFLKTFEALVEKHQVKIRQENPGDSFLEQWYNLPVREEIEFTAALIQEVKDPDIRMALAVILSRVMRSCRATTHADLATLVSPVFAPYYCRKHGKICKPLFSTLKWWERYSKDTLKRLSEFDTLRTSTFQHCFADDSRKVNLFDSLQRVDESFANLAREKKIAGVFSSPPYVGLINYHEQHAYAYALFGFERRDEREIGPLYRGQGREARESYVIGISDVLLNLRPYLREDFDIFLVANDKFGLYPRIVDRAGMKIVNEFKRPVLCRTEKNKAPYSETIFHIKAG